MEVNRKGPDEAQVFSPISGQAVAGRGRRGEGGRIEHGKRTHIVADARERAAAEETWAML